MVSAATPAALQNEECGKAVQEEQSKGHRWRRMREDRARATENDSRWKARSALLAGGPDPKELSIVGESSCCDEFDFYSRRFRRPIEEKSIGMCGLFPRVACETARRIFHLGGDVPGGKFN